MNNDNDGLFNAIQAFHDDSDKIVETYDGVFKSRAFRGVWESNYYDYSRTPQTPYAGINVRPEYNQRDYEYSRPSESQPRDPKGQMHMALQAYKYVPIVRSVMDMMSDFTIEGMRIVHRQKSKMRFMQAWAEKCNFFDVSEHIARSLYVLATAPVRALEGKVPLKYEKEWSKADNEVQIQKQKIPSRVIPLAYKVLNPLTMEVIGGDIATYVGRPIYGLNISQKLKLDMQRLESLAVTNTDFNDLIKHIPDELKFAVKAGKQIVPLDQSKLNVLFYKKNDWETWPTPFLASMFESLLQLEKLHLADRSALDGAISQVRLWRVGIYNESLPQHSIMPTRSMINKVRSILDKVGTGVLEFVWGPELDFKESSSEVAKYLGKEKYEQVMTEIYACLGVPQSLTGGSSQGSSSFTNNAITMKTMVERLEYGRKVLTKFWNSQFAKIQEAFGWKYPAQLMFDRKVLSDETAEKKIILDLWDRDIYATETVLELCNRDPELEIMRHKKEQKRRDNKMMPQKASPYHNPQWETELKKLVLQGGGVAPSEVGLTLSEKKEGEKTRLEQQDDMAQKLADKNNQAKIAQQKSKPTGIGGNGRPKTSRDKTARKPRKAKPKSLGAKGSFINLFIWSNEAQEKINDIISPAYLAQAGKKNIRSLNKQEFEDFENLKFAVFARFAPYSPINEDSVLELLKSEIKIDPDIILNQQVLLKQFENGNERKPNVEEMRQIQSSSYALAYEYLDEKIEIS